MHPTYGLVFSKLFDNFISLIFFGKTNKKKDVIDSRTTIKPLLKTF